LILRVTFLRIGIEDILILPHAVLMSVHWFTPLEGFKPRVAECLHDCPGLSIHILKTYGLVISGIALAGATLATIATIITANTRASLSQGAYGCMCAKNNFTMSPPFFKLSGSVVYLIDE
jgi:hypothetical protein